MGEVIDISRQLSWRRVANLLARGGSIVCHPSDKDLFDEFKAVKVVTSTIMEKGKPYAVDFEEIRKSLWPESLVIGIDWAKE